MSAEPSASDALVVSCAITALVWADDHVLIGAGSTPGETIVNWDVAGARAEAVFAAARRVTHTALSSAG